MTRTNARNFRCLDCGEPVGRSNSRCPACRKVAKSVRNKAYQDRYHAEHRPVPAPKPQPRGDLPPLGQMIHDDDGERVFCHVCGKGYGSLVSHVRTHGLDAARYKERFGLARGTSLLSPATAAKQRARALERNQAAQGVPFGPDHQPGNLRGIEDRLQSQIAKSRAHRQNPDDESSSG